PDSNRRRPAWEAGILPLNYARKSSSNNYLPGTTSVTQEHDCVKLAIYVSLGSLVRTSPSVASGLNSTSAIYLPTHQTESRYRVTPLPRPRTFTGPLMQHRRAP